MTSLHIRDVPDETLRTLKIRAAQSGRSLQSHVRQLLIDETTTLSPDEMMSQARSISTRGRVTEDDVLGEIERMRRDRSV